MRKLHLLLVLCLLPFMVFAQDDNSLSVERLWQLQRIGSPVVSADGRYIVAPVTQYDVKADKAHTRLWLFSADGKQQTPLTAEGLRASEATFSPDGKTLAFISQRDKDDAGQIYLLSMDKPGEAQRLTQVPTGVYGIKWAGKHLYFISRIWPGKSWDEMTAQLKADKDKKVSARQWNALPYSQFDHWIDESRQAHVFRIAASGGDVQAVTQPLGYELPRASQSASSYDIDSKEQYIAFTANGWDNQVDPKTDIFLARIGAANAEGAKSAENLTTDNQAPDANPSFSPDGKSLAFTRQRIHGFYADTAKLTIYDLAKKTSREVASNWDRSVSNFVWTADSRGFYSSIDDAATQRLYHIDAKSGKTRAVTQATSFGQPALAGGNTLVATNDSFMYPARLVTVDTRNGKTTRLDSFNDDILNNTELGSYESVTYKGADGKDIQMWVHYPAGFDKSKKYPLFLLIHGGPHNAIGDSFSYRWNAQTFASWGYVTAWPNFHGSSGFGQDFADAINPDWRTKPLADIQAATKWFENQSWIDTDRMVAGGASYGGYLTSVLLGTEHPFKALLIHAAVYNMYSQMAADFAVHSTRFGGYWENPDIYKNISPHYHADKFNTPTLVIHGQLDYRVPVGQGFELFRTLQSRGVESRMIYFPDENHWILKPNNSIYWYNQVKDWMTKFAEPGAR
ncbi:dipeptidyl aminopeptidase/acylaminoacyl peptidase [Rheinheimera pacifica]|uniref:S9 family peptidase n=1 Tax=Rheinheimera pacifica TaxID=173990 RepID=UPI00216719D0|nr:S9 family peptidase [Rheinheimera pacifica]MCS4308906.1 dipeptidyl aminopeptidase/acylaminoacyl peptidase [Rheinheimera pacifica]